MFQLKLNAIVALAAIVITAPSIATGQVVYSYQLVPQTIYEKKPVTVTRWVDETVTEKQQVTSYKPVWETEARQRKQVSYKPVQKTSEREERIVTYKPVVETLYREQRTEETTYENVTEYHDEQYVVRKPVIETQMREETYTVRKPVTENLVEVQSVTTFKPVLKPQTQLVPALSQVDTLLAVPDTNQRPQLRRLESGYYTDPATGVAVYRRRGLHWVQPTLAVPSASITPTLIPQQTNQVEFVPETVETRKPVEVTRYVDTVVTRKVPVDVERIVESFETRKVPVTMSRPVTKVIVEKVPYTKTTYKEEVVLKKVPYTETTYQKVETVEPYDVEVLKWIPETKVVEVPRTVRRRVDYEIMQDVPRTVWLKVPVDICGNPLAEPIPVYSPSVSSPVVSSPVISSPVISEALSAASVPPSLSSDESTGYGSTLTRRVEPEPAETDPSINGVEPSSEVTPPKPYQGKLQLVRPKTLDETSGRAKSILVPETPPVAESAQTELQKLTRPDGEAETADGESESGKQLEETSGRTEKENAGGQSQADSGGESNPPAKESKPAGDLVPHVSMPEVQPSQTGDENAAERTPDLNPPH